MSGSRLLIVSVRLVPCAVVYASVVAALAWATAAPLADVRRPGPASFDSLLAVTAAAGAWPVLAWLTLGFALSAAAAVPSRIGAWSGRMSRRIAPQAVRRFTHIALGVTVASGAGLVVTTAATAATTALPAATTAGHSGAPASMEALPALDHPALLAEADQEAGAPGAVQEAGAASADQQAIAADAAADTAGDVTALRTPAPPPARTTAPPVTSTPSVEAAAEQRTPAPAAAPLPGPAPRHVAADEVVVQRGDTLWAIAARHLGTGASDAEIAAEWPRWHAANRDVIGDDPDLILPGQRLQPPSPPSAEESR